MCVKFFYVSFVSEDNGETLIIIHILLTFAKHFNVATITLYCLRSRMRNSFSSFFFNRTTTKFETMIYKTKEYSYMSPYMSEKIKSYNICNFY